MRKLKKRVKGTDPIDRGQKSCRQNFHVQPQKGRGRCPSIEDQSKIRGESLCSLRAITMQRLLLESSIFIVDPPFRSWMRETLKN